MKPSYSVGYTLNDDLEVETECRVYVDKAPDTRLNEDLHAVLDPIKQKHDDKYRYVEGVLRHTAYL